MLKSSLSQIKKTTANFAQNFNCKKLNRITLLYQNVRGLRSKTADIYINSQALSHDIFVLTETWLNSSFLDTELFSQEFLVYRKDRHVDKLKEVGGGVLIAVRDKFMSSSVSFPFNLSIELVCIKVTIQSKFVYILNAYIPPKSSHEVYVELSRALDFVIDLSCSNSNILLLGDFNLPYIEWVSSEDESCQEASLTSSQTELQFLDRIISTDLQQVNCIKNSKNRILDLVFSSDAVSTLVLESSPGITNIDSYHPPLDIIFDLSSHLTENSNTYDCSYTFDFRKANFQMLSAELTRSGIDSISVSNNIDEAVNSFYTILNNCMNNTIPIKMLKNSNTCFSWYTKELKLLRNKRNKAWKLYLKTLSSFDHNSYIALFEEFKALSKTLYTDHVKDMGRSLKDDPKRFWKFVNSKKNSDGYPANFTYENCSLQNPIDICNAFANNFRNSFVDTSVDVDETYFRNLHVYAQTSFSNIPVQHSSILEFISSLNDDYSSGPDGIPPILLKKCKNILVHPIKCLFEFSIKSGKFPCFWKNAFLTPVFKKGDKTDIKNYRPIAKLSCIPKLFEQVVCESLAFYTKNIICEQQHGFVRKKSVVTNLLTFLHKCSNALENGSEVDCIYTDFSKAFDQLSHNIIIFKLQAFGFPNIVIEWIRSYLDNRSYQVKFRNCLSDSFNAHSGVPQGSHLGPLLFILAINDVKSCIHYSDILIYADDMKIFKTVKSNSDRILLQADIDSFNVWCDKNSLSLNPVKCQTITFSRKRVPSAFDYSISQHSLFRVLSFKDLGVHFSSNLEFTEHVNYIVKKASSMLGFIKRWAKEFNDPYVTLSLYNCYVRPHLEYASQVWSPFYVIHKHRIESIQHNFIRFALKGLPWSDPYNLPPYEHRIQLLQVQTLYQRRVNNDLIFIHQLITGQIDAPDLLASIGLNYRGGSHHLREFELFHVDFHRTNYGMHEPLNRMSRLYNLNVSSIDFNMCKIRLKKLFQTSAPLS